MKYNLTRGLLLILVPAACLFCGCVTGGGRVERPVLLETATATYLAGESEEAVQLYTDFLGSGPEDAPAAEGYLGRGNAYYKLGKYGLAESDFSGSARLARDRNVKAQATLGLGHAVFAQERYDGAEKIYMLVLRKYRGYVGQDEVTYRLGMALARQGKWDDARIYLYEVISSWPSGEFAKRARAKLGTVAEGFFTVQVGAFTNKVLAEAKAKELERQGFGATVAAIDIDGVPGYAVRSGRFATWGLGSEHAAKLEGAGFSTYRLP